MSKGGGGTTVQKADPWAGQQPYLTDVYSQAQNQFNRGAMQFYPDRLTALPTQTQLDAESLGKLTALGGQSTLAGSLVPAAQFQLAGPANLANNPYLAGATEAALRPLYSQTQGLLQQARRDATGAGQLGGSRQSVLEQGVIGDYLTKAGDITSQMYNTAYKDSLDAQSRALGLVPQNIASLGIPSQTLAGIGATEQARQQQYIDDARARFEFGQQAPSEALSRYSNLVQGSILPGTTTATAPGGGGIGWGTGLGAGFGALAGGGALTGLGIGGMTGAGVGTGVAALGGPMGMAAGAILGSLFD